MVRIEDRSQPHIHAIPKKTANARSTATRVSSCNLPIVAPTLSRGTVWALSIMTCDFFRRPLSVSGSIEILSSGAARSSLVTGKTFTDARVSNRSDCTTSAGRGFPYAPGSTIVTTSPRLTSNLPYQPPLKATSGYCFRLDPFARPGTGADIPPRSLAVACPAPKSAPAANQRPEVQADAFGRAEQRQVVRPRGISSVYVTCNNTSSRCYMQQIAGPFSATVTTGGECRERRPSRTTPRTSKS
jgi:hypothetical protein